MNGATQGALMQTLIPHIYVSNAAGAIDFYKAAFGAKENSRNMAPDGKRIMHADLEILGSTLMLNDDFPEMCGGKSQTPEAFGGSPVILNLVVDNADDVFAKATAAGATVTMPLADMFWGDRYGHLRDPYGHTWAIIQHLQQKSREEIEAAMKQTFKM
jgi:PhnB protein